MRNFEQYGSGAIVFSHQKIRLENDKKKVRKRIPNPGTSNPERGIKR